MLRKAASGASVRNSAVGRRWRRGYRALFRINLLTVTVVTTKVERDLVTSGKARERRAGAREKGAPPPQCAVLLQLVRDNLHHSGVGERSGVADFAALRDIL